MAKILLIETSGEVCSAAISVDGKVLALVEAPDTQSHAALLTLQIGECSNKAGILLADLDAVAVSKGPGAYTSLRVGASVAKGICFALDKPLIAVDTLLALAHASRLWVGKIPSGNLPTVAPIYVPMHNPTAEALRPEWRKSGGDSCRRDHSRNPVAQQKSSRLLTGR